MNSKKDRIKSAAIKKRQHRHGFTLVEIIIVIIIIGILTTIMIVSYNGIQAKARDTSVLSDIDVMDGLQTNFGLANKVSGKAYYSGNVADTDLNFNPSNGNVIDVVVNDTDYCIRGYNPKGTKNSIDNAFTKGSSSDACSLPELAASQAARGVALACPSGFIVVPGSSTYGTVDFCVMKYEAKQSSATVPVSQAGGTPWTSISQVNATTDSHNVGGCTGCHLITEAEWLTIAQNVLNVSSNWSGNAIGSGYIYSGHSDSAPDSALVADPSDLDNNGYYGETNTGGNQRRTLTLTNGKTIWDFAGNVWEWTSGTSTTGQPGVNGSGYSYREWNIINNPGTISPNPSPSATGVAGANGWTTAKGIGQIYSSVNETNLSGIIRGGDWEYGFRGGVLAMTFYGKPSNFDMYTGFRVSSPLQ